LVLEPREGEGASGQFGFEIVRHFDLSLLSGSDVKRFNHPPRRRIRLSTAFHLLPKLTPVRIWQQVFLPLAIEKGSRLAA
jgi:hypothetical protein